MSFLTHIAKIKKDMVKQKKSELPLSEIKKKLEIKKRPFFATFSERGIIRPKIIAEVKKASPSKGVLRADFDPMKIAKIYEDSGASAISVITEEEYFLGSVNYLKEIREFTALPILRKDFIIDEYEIYESVYCGADCLLLISELLDKSQLKEYAEICKEVGLDVLIEVHSLKAYEKISVLSEYLLGINNRDLESLEINVDNGLNILKDIPSYQPVIIESGIENKEAIKKYLLASVSGFLIGSSLVRSPDISEKLREFLDVAL